MYITNDPAAMPINFYISNYNLSPGSRWISLRDPEKDGAYLVTLAGELAGQAEPFVGIAVFRNGHWDDYDETCKYVLAWMQLPEPYKKTG